jgi:uncharacterized protein (DUF488 family)
VSGMIFTVGHSTHSVDKLMQLLKHNEVTAVADVRSQPYSRMNPQFNRESLREVLKEVRIEYAFLGDELGARTGDPNCYVDGKVQYDRLASTEQFKHGLTRIIDGSRRFKIALLCAEKDPLTCHRTILVVRHLLKSGLSAAHILADGSLEKHDDALERLFEEEGITTNDFFRPRQELIDEAYAKRGQRIAYVEKLDSGDTHERHAI